MADVTGGTPPTNASPFAVPADLTDIYDHFGDTGKYTYALIASLPASGNWTGRTAYVAEDGSYRVWSGSAWVTLVGESAGTVSAAAGTVTVKSSTFMRKSVTGYVSGYAEIERTTANGGITSSTVFAIMQAGFRPSQTYTFQATVIGTTSASAIVQVAATGNVTFFAIGSLPSSPQSFTFNFHYPAA